MKKDLRFKEVSLIFEKREDGGLRVWSDDVPGFVLSHSDCEAVFADIAPALETIITEILGAPVRVGPAEGLREHLEDRGFIPAYGASVKRNYVAQLEVA
jgi:hypothetical protein